MNGLPRQKRQKTDKATLATAEIANAVWGRENAEVTEEDIIEVAATEAIRFYGNDASTVIAHQIGRPRWTDKGNKFWLAVWKRVHALQAGGQG